MRQRTLWLSMAALLLPTTLWPMPSMAADASAASSTSQKVGTPSSNAPARKQNDASRERLDGATLGALLGADIAAQRGDMGLAARTYLQQSQRHPDIALARRATQIARLSNDPKLVVAAANRWAALDRNSATPRRILAAAAAEQGEWATAMALLLEVDASGQDADLESFLEEAITSGAQPEELLAPLESYLKRHPDQPHPLITRALLQSLQGNNDAADQDLERAQTLDARLPALWLARSQIALDREDAARALEYARRGHDLAPSDNRFILAMAQANLAMNDVDAAEKQFDILIKEMPDNLQLRLALAQLYLRNDHAEAAQRLLKPALAEDSASPSGDLYMLAGLASERLDDIDQALSLYARVPEGEHFMTARVRGVQLFSEQKRIDDALRWLQGQENDYPDQYAALMELSLSLLDQNDQQARADQMLDSAITSRAPDNDSLLYIRAVRAIEHQDLKAMERDMRTLLKRDPDNVDALNAFGYTLTEQTDRHEEALELLERAHRLAPESAPVVDSLGWAHFHLGQLDQAVALLKQAYALMPDEEVAAHLAEALWADGDSEQARRIIAGAMARFRNHPTIDGLLSRYPLLTPLGPPPQATNSSTVTSQENTP
ncbi:tetratricopeptide repeat protein [Kushneria phyllosphaerae]|uniref:Lipopolysaccharide assembly protein B n=1 Tax=Kushneria phyllosphaerae TaxID=2100822 RepID=A0A2R8CQF8_9GAMM|nr:tetratricopeptide repeat protein [Kushneria phyllosphaerae]SPJ35127.1 Lipopolysaccharide assembly protein B [Kushneria phyllosphaerae]